MSTMLPAPIVVGTQPASPIRKRKAINMPMLTLHAAAILKAVKAMLPM